MVCNSVWGLGFGQGLLRLPRNIRRVTSCVYRQLKLNNFDWGYMEFALLFLFSMTFKPKLFVDSKEEGENIEISSEEVKVINYHFRK